MYKWTRIPPPRQPSVIYHHWFMSEWNMGFYQTPKLKIFKGSQIPILLSESAQTTSPAQGKKAHFDNNPTLLPQQFAPPGNPRMHEENLHLQAHLYSLTAPNTDRTMHFGSNHEHICIDTGALACPFTTRENFIKLNKVEHIKINGIGTGLPVEVIGTRKSPIEDDHNNKIDLHIHNALFMLSAPMGLLCPQQIAMQTKHPQDGFNALSHAGILTIEGCIRTIPYDPKFCLPILHTIDGADNLHPGDKVSVDQLESTTPGHVGIFKGRPT